MLNVRFHYYTQYPIRCFWRNTSISRKSTQIDLPSTFKYLTGYPKREKWRNENLNIYNTEIYDSWSESPETLTVPVDRMWLVRGLFIDNRFRCPSARLPSLGGRMSTTTVCLQSPGGSTCIWFQSLGGITSVYLRSLDGSTRRRQRLTLIVW